MTDKVQKIREEVARLKSQLIKGATRCREEAYNEVLAILDSIQASEVESKSKFKAGDHIKPIDSCLGSPRTILEVCDGWYVTDQGTLDFEYEDNWVLVEEPAGLDKWPVWNDDVEQRIREKLLGEYKQANHLICFASGCERILHEGLVEEEKSADKMVEYIKKELGIS